MTNAWTARLGLPPERLLPDAPMSRFTTLRLGGPADVLCDAASAEEIARILTAAREAGVPVTVIGNGSNLLVRDGGIRGLVLRLGSFFSNVSAPIPLSDGRFALTAEGGALLSKLAGAAADAGLEGLAFAGGIPGTVGGAVFMNAGAYGGEMKDVVTSVEAVTRAGEKITLSAEELRLGYRTSALSEMADPPVVTSVTVALRPGDSASIRQTMRELNARRREKQPLTVPSCGSTFKRPEGHFAAALIEQCGLKGFRVGGASVSALHAGFLVNDGNGTAAEYEELIRTVQRVVKEKTGVMLETEVRILGEY